MSFRGWTTINGNGITYSIVVPAYNAGAFIARCLDALVRQRGQNAAREVIVVDDGSTDDTAAVASRYEGVTVLSQPNAGPAAARNRGAREARGEIIVFVDADCEPTEEWLAELTRPFREGENVSATKGAYRTRQRAWAARFAQLEFEGRYRILARHREITFVDSYSAAIRLEAFKAVGGFDPHFPMADHEDVDLSFKLARAGYKMVFCPRAIVYHRHQETWRRYLALKLRRAYWRARVYKRFPERILADTYTPQVTKFQLLLMGSSVLTAAAGLAWRPVLWGVAALAGVFVLTTLPCIVRTLRADPPIALVVIPVLTIRTFLSTMGAAAGFLSRRRRDLLFPMLNVIGDVAAVIAAINGVFWVRANLLSALVDPIWHPLAIYQRAGAAVVAAWLVVFATLGLYGVARTTSFLSEALKVFRGIFLVVIICMAASYVVKFEFSRLIMALFAVAVLVLALGERFLIRLLKDAMQRRGLYQTRVLIVGTGEAARTVAERIRNFPAFGYHLAGFVDDDGPGVAGDGDYHGVLNSLPAVVREYYVDEVLVAKPTLSRDGLLDLVLLADTAETPIRVLYGALDALGGGYEARSVGDIPVLDFAEAPFAPAKRFAKRLGDLLVVAAVAPLWLPLASIVTLAAALSARQWPVKRRLTLGRGGEPFTRWDLPVENWGRFGTWVRTTALENVLWVFSVASGAMSVVGPRPRDYAEARLHTSWRRYRYRVKPGMVGFWYVGAMEDVGSERELEFDLYYVKNQDTVLDATLLLRSFAVFFRRALQTGRRPETAGRNPPLTSR